MKSWFFPSGWILRGICYRMVFFKGRDNSNRRSSLGTHDISLLSTQLFWFSRLNASEDSNMIWHKLTLGYLAWKTARHPPNSDQQPQKWRMSSSLLIVLGVQISLLNCLQNCSIIPRSFPGLQPIISEFRIIWGIAWRTLNFWFGVDASWFTYWIYCLDSEYLGFFHVFFTEKINLPKNAHLRWVCLGRCFDNEGPPRFCNRFELKLLNLLSARLFGLFGKRVIRWFVEMMIQFCVRTFLPEIYIYIYI